MDHRPIPHHWHTGLTARGFTAIELLVVLAILAVLATLAAPSFNNMIVRWRVLETREAFQSTLFLARSEAIKRGGSVNLARHPTLCLQGDDDDDAPKDWGCGWLVYFDADRNGSYDASKDTILQEYAAAKAVKLETNTEQFSLDRWGMAGMNAFSVHVSAGGSGTTTVNSMICVSSGGRIRVVDNASSCEQP